jgi:hypothetical protein
VSGSCSRTGIGAVPRTTTICRNACSSAAAASGLSAAGPLIMPRRNQRGPSTPTKRAARRTGAGAGCPGCAGGVARTKPASSGPKGPSTSFSDPP